jgi:acyl-CoA reductase-like NAD-dependent aldehyde dehydrogenase
MLQASFTGSTEVGRLICPWTPLIIFDDSDLDMAVDLAIRTNLFNKVNL